MSYKDSGVLRTNPLDVADDKVAAGTEELDSASKTNLVLENGIVRLKENIPDSILYQHDAQTFSTGDTTWADSVGAADMSVSGDPQSVSMGSGSGVEGDGTDDYGLAPTQDLVTYQEWGIAFTFSLASISSSMAYAGAQFGTNTRFALFSGVRGTAGNINPDLVDGNGNRVMVNTDNTFDDGTPHSVVINKNGNTASDISIYVDDMSTPVATTTQYDQAYDHTTVSLGRDLAYFAYNNQGTLESYMPVTFGVMEFNSQTYTQTEREDFVGRRPEV